jgi:hypothetical protein
MLICHNIIRSSRVKSECVLTFTIQGYQTNQHQHRVNLAERKRLCHYEIPQQINKQLEASFLILHILTIRNTPQCTNMCGKGRKN